MTRRLSFNISIIIALALLSQTAYAQGTPPLRVELNVSRDTVFVGDTFDLTVHFEYTSEMGQIEVDQPVFPEMIEFEKVGIIKMSQRQTLSRNSMTGKNQARASYDFTRTYRALTTGEFEIQGIELVVNDPSQPGGKMKTRTPVATITVLAVGPDSEEKIAEQESDEPEEKEDIRDIKDPIPAPQWVLYLLGIGATGILLALAMIMARVIKPSAIRVPQKVAIRKIVNPYDRAIRKLKDIQTPETGANDDQITTFYIRLSDIVKEYVGAKHNVLGFEATSYEITSSMKEVYGGYSDGDRLIASLELFLNEIDLAKYAMAKREGNFMEEGINRAKDFIEMDNRYVKHQMDDINNSEEIE